MTDLEASATLRLGQFLDLAAQWLGACPAAEASHRICRTASLLLDIPYVALGVARGNGYELIGSSLSDDDDGGGDAVLEAALASGSPQLRSGGCETVGVFPFGAVGEIEGCLHVRVPRANLSATEISCLRFLASLSGVMLATGPAAAVIDAGALRSSRPADVAEPLPAHPRAESAAGGRNGAPVPEGAARRYVAMAVHDLRNPLNVVAGYAALLEEESLGAITPEQREAVEAIGRQARVLHSAVDQLIDLDRMASGDQVSVSQFEVGGLFDELRRTCFPDANGRVRWPGRESDFEFSSDRRRVYSIVQNLVDNALKHTSEDEVYVACEQRGEDLVLLVCDHGPGLSEELRTKLVAQARTGAEAAPRSGLGLYSVASHVHALGGAVHVEVAQAGGTAVRVNLPPVMSDARGTQGAHGEPAAESDAGGPRTRHRATSDTSPGQNAGESGREPAGEPLVAGPSRARKKTRRRPPRDVDTRA